MAEIIEMLTPKIDHCPYFTVDNTVNNVDLVQNSAIQEVYYSPVGFSKFTKGDCFIVLSVGYFIPAGFQIFGYQEAGADLVACPYMILSGFDALGHVLFEPFGNGRLKIPFPNYEFSLGIFINPINEGLVQPDFQVTGIFPDYNLPDKPQISMINVPASVNGLVFKVVPFIKIMHNIPLTA